MDMSKPLCIDLFCGLFKTQLFRRANALINQSMASWAKNPNHVRFCVLHFSPFAITSEFWPVRQFQYPAFTARLTGLRKVRVLPSNPDNNSGIFVGAARVVNRKDSRVSLVKAISAVLGALYSAGPRAVSTVTVWGLDLKDSSAHLARFFVLSGTILLSPSNPSLSGLASEGAIFFINPASNEFSTTRTAE